MDETNGSRAGKKSRGGGGAMVLQWLIKRWESKLLAIQFHASEYCNVMLTTAQVVIQLFSHNRVTHVGPVSRSMRWVSYWAHGYGYGYVRGAAQSRIMLTRSHPPLPMSLETSLLLSAFGWWVTWLFFFPIFLSESFKPLIMNYLSYSFHLLNEHSGKPPSSCISFTHHHCHLIVKKKKRLLELFSAAFRNLDKTIFLRIPL